MQTWPCLGTRGREAGAGDYRVFRIVEDEVASAGATRTGKTAVIGRTGGGRMGSTTDRQERSGDSRENS